MSETPSPVPGSVRDLLDAQGVERQEVHHEPMRTSEESARARGVPLALGGKALLMKAGGQLALFVISAARKLDSAALSSLSTG